MTIGGHLSRIPPAQRDEDSIKIQVNAAATEIAQEYLSEIAPYSKAHDLHALFTTFPRNVLTRKDVQQAVRKYKRDAHMDRSTEDDIFGFLYGAGLLGVISTDLVKGRKVQRFLRPGASKLAEVTNLPDSSHYLLHPNLSELIGRSNDRYIADADRTNIVGDGRRWKDDIPQFEMCVLMVDIGNFSDMMARGIEMDVRQRFKQAVQAHTCNCACAQLEGGDSLTVLHKDPGEIVKVARRIMEDLHEAPGRAVLRVAIDRGTIMFQAKEPAGLPLRKVARLERHVNPGEIWVTASFREALEDGKSFFKAVPVLHKTMPINIKKPGSSEDDEFVRVFRVVERRPPH